VADYSRVAPWGWEQGDDSADSSRVTPGGWEQVKGTGGGSYTVTADAGAYTLAGQDAALVKSRIVVADAGSYALAGQDASVLVGHKLTADAGTYTLAGQDAALLRGRVVDAGAGAYALAGQDATLTYAPSGSYSLTADAGAYALAGQAATLLLARVMSADAGVYALAGQDATITHGGTTATVGRPTSDASNTGWTASAGSDLYAMLDEVVPDAADYIVTTATGSICEVALNTTAYPGTAAQKLSYRASSSTGNSVIVRLKEGATTIRSETQVLTASDTLYEITLTAPEIAAITSGSLSVELESA